MEDEGKTKKRELRPKKMLLLALVMI